LDEDTLHSSPANHVFERKIEKANVTHYATEPSRAIKQDLTL